MKPDRGGKMAVRRRRKLTALLGVASANRRAWPGSAPAPPPPPCRRAGFAGRGSGAIRADRRGSLRVRRRQSRLRGRQAARRHSQRSACARASSGLRCGASSSQNTRSCSSGPMRQRLIQRLGLGDLRRPDHAALLAGLDCVGAQEVEVDARGLGAAGQEGRKRRAPISIAFCAM